MKMIAMLEMLPCEFSAAVRRGGCLGGFDQVPVSFLLKKCCVRILCLWDTKSNFPAALEPFEKEQKWRGNYERFMKGKLAFLRLYKKVIPV